MQRGRQFWEKKLGTGWTKQLKNLLQTSYSDKLINTLQTEYALNDIKPIKKDVFKAYKLCTWESLKIVIFAGEPHNTCYEPNGLAFGDKITSFSNSPTLCKIYDCIEREYYHNSFYLDFDFTLENWANQGVLLLNRSLTVRNGVKGSHKKYWTKFITETLNVINDYNPGTIFMLWGKEAQSIKSFINKNNYILTYDHPSQYVYPSKDWHCPNFKEADKILIDLYGETIKW